MMKLDIFVGNGRSMQAFSRGFFERNKLYPDTEEKYLFCGHYRFRERDYNDRSYREVFDRYFKAFQRKNPDFQICITEVEPEEAL